MRFSAKLAALGCVEDRCACARPGALLADVPPVACSTEILKLQTGHVLANVANSKRWAAITAA
jgi:hypothetical protein